MKKANSIKEAMEILDFCLDNQEDERNFILNMYHINQMITYHHGIGRTIRNEWGLWQEEPNNLKKELISYGSGKHPDDMSMFILHIFYYHVKFPEMKIENIINEMIIKKLLE